MSAQPGKPMSSWRRRCFRGLGLLVGLLVGALIGEVGVRFFDLAPRPLPALEVGYYEMSPNRLLKYRFRPNMTPDQVGSSGDHNGFRINAAGFRDVDHAVTKPDGVTRIIILGDSVTAGVGVEDVEAIFPRRLESLLNRSKAAGSVEVVNLGVGGYHTLQEVETLRVVGLGYEPDQVVVGFCVNDFDWEADGSVVDQIRQRLAPGQQSVLLKTWRSAGWLNDLLSRSRLLFFAYHRLGRPGSFLDLEWRRESRSGHVGTPFRLGMNRLQELANRNGFGCHVFLIPAFDRPFTDYRYSELHERARAIVADLPAITVVDLLQGFQGQDLAAAELSDDGLHPNREGHAELARLIAGHLQPHLPRLGGSHQR